MRKMKLQSFWCDFVLFDLGFDFEVVLILWWWWWRFEGGGSVGRWWWWFEGGGSVGFFGMVFLNMGGGGKMICDMFGW